jgi:putative ABC transport system permease protein
VGIVLGAAGAHAAGRMMEGIVWGVSGLPAAALAAVSSLLLLTALVACLVPARRAASVDPMVALRHE